MFFLTCKTNVFLTHFLASVSKVSASGVYLLVPTAVVNVLAEVEV